MGRKRVLDEDKPKKGPGRKTKKQPAPALKGLLGDGPKKLSHKQKQRQRKREEKQALKASVGAKRKAPFKKHNHNETHYRGERTDWWLGCRTVPAVRGDILSNNAHYKWIKPLKMDIKFRIGDEVYEGLRNTFLTTGKGRRPDLPQIPRITRRLLVQDWTGIIAPDLDVDIVQQRCHATVEAAQSGCNCGSCPKWMQLWKLPKVDATVEAAQSGYLKRTKKTRKIVDLADRHVDVQPLRCLRLVVEVPLKPEQADHCGRRGLGRGQGQDTRLGPRKASNLVYARG
ncbi:hypothetical protein EGW08_020487 [Elysia chlorotica]|uniref:Uncharacterized protein n=1 Tax=Elysia chlorotica TaxID=188477 RepID=A0A433SR77_ELYCH|nr:hypothetical protein EGW08_020487 [Elysia chlorotica]